MKTFVLSAAALLATIANGAMAQIITNPKPPVPEIDAMAGIAAIAAVGAVVALIRERRKR